ncbi:MAG: DUF3347 domain-containing protein [Chitinophagales bacterium]
MKKYLLMVMILATTAASNIFAQDVSSNPLQPVVTSYIGLKNALAIDRGDSARASAKVLYDAIDKVPMDKLSEDQHKSWMQYNEKLSHDAEHIKSTNELAQQREHFAKLSSNMSKMLKAMNMNDTDLYIQFCPMAEAGKGAYWVSEQSTISNPYMGKRMPACGKTTETLKAND